MTDEQKADWMTRGKNVCITGRGIERGLHTHNTIDRVTRTMIVLRNTWRFRIDSLEVVPKTPHGGCSISPDCQRPDMN